MKKLLILLITLLTPSVLAYGEVVRNYNHPTVYKTIYFKAGEKDANKILYEFIKNDTTKELHDYLKLSEFSVCAYKVDLDEDGVNEIVGFVSSSYYEGWDGYNLFILKKKNNEYVDISFVQFYPYTNLYVLKSKTNNYRDLKFKFSREPCPAYGYSSYMESYYKYNYQKMPKGEPRKISF